MHKTRPLLICSFLLLLLATSQSLFAQYTPGERHKQKQTQSKKGANRYSSGSSGTPVNGETQAVNDSIIAAEKTGVAAQKEFMKQSGFPMGRPGYILDYKVALDKGGCDCIANMQWITFEEAIKQGKIE